jgi:hypothetical protein
MALEDLYVKRHESCYIILIMELLTEKWTHIHIQHFIVFTEVIMRQNIRFISSTQLPYNEAMHSEKFDALTIYNDDVTLSIVQSTPPPPSILNSCNIILLALFAVCELIGACNHDFGIQALLNNRNWIHLMNKIMLLFPGMQENTNYIQNMLTAFLLAQSHPKQ